MRPYPSISLRVMRVIGAYSITRATGALARPYEGANARYSRVSIERVITRTLDAAQ